MSEFTDFEQNSVNGPEPKVQRRRGPKPGQKRVVKTPAVTETSAEFPHEEIAAAIKMIRSLPPNIRKCAMKVVWEMGEA